jgi:hypothetical protein
VREEPKFWDTQVQIPFREDGRNTQHPKTIWLISPGLLSPPIGTPSQTTTSLTTDWKQAPNLFPGLFPSAPEQQIVRKISWCPPCRKRFSV